MTTFNRLPSGYWRAQVRRKGQYISRSFRLKSDAEAWATDAERTIYRGKSAGTVPIDGKTSFATLIELHIMDLMEVGRPLQDEICCLLWKDIDFSTCLAIVRNRKDPRRKSGNDQRVPLLNATGYDAIALIKEQRALARGGDRVFPYNGRSLGTAFRRSCRELEIEHLRFHDLRHEATSRLFEAGFDIPEVSLVTGHKDWKMLRRYLNLRPRQLVGRAPSPRRYLI